MITTVMIMTAQNYYSLQTIMSFQNRGRKELDDYILLFPQLASKTQVRTNHSQEKTKVVV